MNPLIQNGSKESNYWVAFLINDDEILSSLLNLKIQFYLLTLLNDA